MFDILKNGLRNISRKRMRSTLTIMGIAIGVMSVIIISMIGKIGTTNIQRELESMGIGGIVMTTDVLTTKTFTSEDIDTVKNMEEIQAVSPFITSYSSVKSKGKNNSCMLWGIDKGTTEIVSMELLHGRLLNDSDVKGVKKVCMVDETFAKEQYERANIVGKKIDIAIDDRYEEFEVVGVIKAGGNIVQSFMGSVVPCFVYVPYTTMDITDIEDGFNQIVAQTKSDTDIDALSTAIEKDFKQNRDIKVKISDLNGQMENLNDILNIVSLVLTVIAGISLFVAGLSIMTVMLVSVSERTVEIGIKKAIGASRQIILLEFVSESLFISLIGALIGIGGGMTIVIAGCLILGISVIIDIPMILFSLSFALLVGTIFGIYPAIKASNLKPVDAIRS